MSVVPRRSITTIRRAALRTDSAAFRMDGLATRFRRHVSRWSFSLVFFVTATVMAAGAAGRLAVLQQQYQKAHSQFISELESIAVACEQAQLASLAKDVRHLQSPPETLGSIDKLPAQVQPDIPMELPAVEKTARVKLRKLQTDYATNLYGQSKRALNDQHTSLAFRLVNEVLIHNPDHPQARGLLGYQRVGNEWTTHFAMTMKREKKVWHDEFGWIQSAHIPRYEKGERYYNGKWMTAQREETLRADFKNAWEVDTEHFHVETNYSQERGVHLAAAVEVFHRYFMREFAAFFKTPQQLGKLFAGGAASGEENRYDIYYFRERQEFVNRLTKECAIAGQINGLYLPKHRIAYFFHNPDIPEEESLETLYHEVTHQLLSESTLKTVPVGHSQDFWVIEGIACYFESFRVEDDGAISVGDVSHPRILAARRQVVTDHEQEPLARFTALGMLKFQAGTTPELQKRYAQATGLAHFFMHYQDGVYRDEFIEYLTQIYSPVQRLRGTKSLEDCIGVSYATLDSQYAAYFKEMPAAETTQVH